MDGVRSLNRMLDILEIISGGDRPVSLSGITGMTRLPKSTACRMVSVLEDRGYVARDAETGRFSPGLKLLTAAGAMMNSLDPAKAAHPFLRSLSEKTAETVHLMVSSGDAAVYVDKIEYPNTIKLESQLGKRVPLYCTAAGKAMLAERSREEIALYMGNTVFKAFTKNTITDPGILMDELRKIRKKGWSLDNAEYEDSVRCVGAPVRGRSGKAEAAISVSGPAFRIRIKDLSFLAEAIIEASRKISESLGYEPPRNK